MNKIKGGGRHGTRECKGMARNQRPLDASAPSGARTRGRSHQAVQLPRDPREPAWLLRVIDVPIGHRSVAHIKLKDPSTPAGGPGDGHGCPPDETIVLYPEAGGRPMAHQAVGCSCAQLGLRKIFFLRAGLDTSARTT